MQSLAPVVVDLDGTLIKSDTLLESLMALLKQNPFWCFLLPIWLLKGKAYLKNRIAEKVELDPVWLPYNQEVIDYIVKLKEQGHQCYLATGTVSKFAEPIAAHVGLFTEVFSTNEHTNLTGKNKLALLLDKFGSKAFIYLGNHAVDLPIWQESCQAVVVSSSERLIAQAKSVATNTVVIKPEKASSKVILKAMRVHQWVKNALIFVPLLTSHQVINLQLLVLSLVGFLAYSLAASSVYILNDLVDLPADRQHASKRKRPFAAGSLSIVTGLLLFPSLLVVAFILSAFLPVKFQLALVVYYALTLIYSFKLKRVIMLDTILLAGLYTMRIIAGTLLIDVKFSFWLLAFSMFIFLSLAFVKRYTELVAIIQQGTTKMIGRGYHTEDAGMVSSFGAASGYIAVLVFALYVNSPEVATLYKTPDMLWLACPILLYWISRVWILAHRGEMNDDPIVFAVKDLQSLITGIIVLVIFLAANQ